MNRDNLRFRAWCEKFKVYAPINGSFSIPGEPHNIAFDPVYISADGRLYEVNNYDGREVCQVEDVTECYTIERCTGLKDKNGNLIYVGDVLEFYINTRPVYVQWDSDKCCFVLQRFDVEGWAIRLAHDTASKYAIIGNIHEMGVTN